jgi:hypothetical protein
MRTIKPLAGLALALTIAAGAAVQGHHSNVTFYDFEQMRELSGTVVRLRLINPHINLRLEVTEADGQKAVWIFDGPNASAVRANGWSENTLTPGEMVKVKFHPARNPDFKGGYGEEIVKADGRTLEFGGNASN